MNESELVDIAKKVIALHELTGLLCAYRHISKKSMFNAFYNTVNTFPLRFNDYFLILVGQCGLQCLLQTEILQSWLHVQHVY